MMHDYQRKRILIFLDPESDPLGAGYHITQSKIAIGSGGIWGKGYLTAARATSIICPKAIPTSSSRPWSRNGAWSAASLLILAFAMVIRWGMKVARNSQTRFGQLAAAGLTATIFFYVAINLMMVMGLAPVVGVPLPLVSFGGSAVMTS